MLAAAHDLPASERAVLAARCGAGALVSIVHHGLLERAPHLELIEVVLQQTQQGVGQLLWIEGAAGAGKTSLLRAALAEARARQLAVLQATAGELESDHVLGVVRQLFDPLLRRRSPAELDRLFAGPAGAARAALLDAPSPDRDADSGDDTGPDPITAQLRSGALHHGLYWLVARLSDEAPLVLCVDDLHWVDAASLSFVAFLARRLEDIAVALVIGTRPVVAHDEGRDPRARIRAHPAAHHLRPPPLSSGAVATLVRTHTPGASDEQCQAVFEASGGNPFLVEVAAGMAHASPEHLHGEVRRQLAALDPEVQLLAKAVAVLGVDRPLAAAAAVAGMPPAAALDAATMLRAHEWLELDRPDPDDGRRPGPTDVVRFRHPLVRDAVVQLSSARELDELHARAIDVLVARQRDPAEIAMHALASLPRGDGATVRALLVAAEQARRSGAPREAMRLLERAAAEPPSGEDRCEVLVALARAATTAASPGADRHVARALAALDDPTERNRLRLRVAGTLIGTQRSGSAAALIEEALAEDDGEDRTMHVELLATRLVALRVDPERRREWEAGLDELVALGIDDDAIDPRVPAVRAARAELAYRDGVMGQSFDRARRLAIEAVGDPAGHTLAAVNGNAFSTAMHALLQVGELQLAADVSARAMREAQEAGYGSVFRLASTYHAVAVLRLGQPREAIADAVIDEVMERHLTVLVPLNAVTTAQAYLMLGRLDDAGAALDPPGGAARFRHELTYGGIPEWRGWLLLAHGRPEEAASSFLELATATSTLGGAHPSTNTWRSGLARAQLQTGDQRGARRISDEELELARAWGGWRQLGLALTTAGLVQTGSRAAAALDEAVAVLEKGVDPYLLGWAHLHRGRQRRTARHRSDARDDFRCALDIGHRHDFSLLAEAANDALIDAGGRPRTRVLTGVDALTPAELRVARAVASGLSNADVAANLFITRKAVEYHLSNVYRKLGIRGRGELAGALG